MKDRTLYALAIHSIRYALKRDNHLAPFTSKECIKEILGNFEDQEYKKQLVEKLITEIEGDLLFSERKYKDFWLEFKEELLKGINI